MLARLKPFAVLSATTIVAVQIAIGLATFCLAGRYNATLRFGGFALTIQPSFRWGGFEAAVGFRDERTLLPKNAPRPYLDEWNDLEWHPRRRFPRGWWPAVQILGDSNPGRVRPYYLDIEFYIPSPLWFALCFFEAGPLFFWYRRRLRQSAQRERGFPVSQPVDGQKGGARKRGHPVTNGA